MVLPSMVLARGAGDAQRFQQSEAVALHHMSRSPIAYSLVAESGAF